MRGTDEQQVTMPSLDTPDKRVPANRPLRRIKALADQALAGRSPTFDQRYIARTRDRRRRSAVDGRTTRHEGYEVSQRIRKRVEEIFGWTKTVGCFRKTRFKGQSRTQLAAHVVAAAYNPLRMS